MDKVGSICAFNYKVGSIFILKIFLPPDWSLSNNVLIGSYGGWAQLGPRWAQGGFVNLNTQGVYPELRIDSVKYPGPKTAK